MLRVAFRRFLILIPTLILSSVLIFALVQIIPGGAAETLAGDDASPQTIARIQQQLGLDRPLYEQYWGWMTDAVKGNFGRSLLDTRYVGEDIRARFPNTLELSLAALFIALLLGIP